MVDVGAKALRVDRTIEDRRGRDAVRPQTGHDRVGLPMTARSVIREARAARTAAVAPQQIGGDATLIDKDVPPDVAQRQPGAPAAALSGDVGPPLFVGVYGFF